MSSFNFDPKLDYGTHFAALLAGRNASREIIGIDPKAVLYAVTPSDMKNILDSEFSLNLCSISLGSRPSPPSAGPGAPTDPIQFIYSIIKDDGYRSVLFVVAGGAEGAALPSGSLAELGS